MDSFRTVPNRFCERVAASKNFTPDIIVFEVQSPRGFADNPVKFK